MRKPKNILTVKRINAGNYTVKSFDGREWCLYAVPDPTEKSVSFWTWHEDRIFARPEDCWDTKREAVRALEEWVKQTSKRIP